MQEQRKYDNGSLTYRWLAGLTLSLVILGGGGWVSLIHAQVVSQSDRLARVETVILRLPIIEQKLDRVLETR